LVIDLLPGSDTVPSSGLPGVGARHHRVGTVTGAA
jgi:hypothetical protein